MTDEDIREFSERLGNHLKQLRRSKHITQERIAEECNTTKSTISRIESGKKIADFAVLKAYEKVTNIPLQTIISGDDLNVAPELNVITCLFSMSRIYRNIAYRIIYDIWDMDLKVKSKHKYQITEHTKEIFSLNDNTNDTPDETERKTVPPDKKAQEVVMNEKLLEFRNKFGDFPDIKIDKSPHPADIMMIDDTDTYTKYYIQGTSMKGMLRSFVEEEDEE